jgi:hypothetical protein
VTKKAKLYLHKVNVLWERARGIKSIESLKEKKEYIIDNNKNITI